MEEKIKTISAFTLLGILMIIGFVLIGLNHKTDVYPKEDTMIRLHDTGRRWYYIFMSLIPVVGTIILIVFLCQPTNSNEGEQV